MASKRTNIRALAHSECMKADTGDRTVRGFPN